MGIKKVIFELLPESVQHRIIMRKTGHRFIAGAPLTAGLSADFFLPPKSKTWETRLSRPYGHEPAIVKWFERNLRKEDVVYDVGAHLGFFGVLVNRIHPGIAFHGFEGNWFIAHYQQLNRKHLGMESTWRINQKLVGPSSGNGFIAIDDYLRNQSAPSIFQMDVDGEEINVLSGAQSLLSSGTTTFLIEVHPTDLATRNQTIEQFFALFNPSLYSFRYLPDLRSEHSDWKDSLTDAEKKEEFYFLATPRTAPRP